MKHTPGPWKVFKQHNPKPNYSTTWHLDSPTRAHMATLEVLDINSSPKWREEHPEEMKEHEETMLEVEANAQLMAASPLLLEALIYLLEQTVEQDLKYGIVLTEGEADARELGREAVRRAKEAHT